MNYYLKNNYLIEDKSFAHKTLDWLSTPCRGVLGGRAINLVTGEEGQEWTTVKKVAAVVFSIIFFPIAVISVFSFALKAAIFPFHGEKKVLKAWEKMKNSKDAFDAYYKANEYPAALSIVSSCLGIKAVKQEELYQIGRDYLNNDNYFLIFPSFNQTYLNSSYTEKLIKDVIQYYLTKDFKQLTEENLRLLINCNCLSNPEKIDLIKQLLDLFKPDESEFKLVKLKVSIILIHLRKFLECEQNSTKKNQILWNAKDDEIDSRAKLDTGRLLKDTLSSLDYLKLCGENDYDLCIQHLNGKLAEESTSV